MSAAPRSGDPLAVLRRRLSLPALGVPVPERHAAVLVALSGPSDALDVTLTRRAEHMNSHAGEVALPGGKHEPGDADLDVTALRESAEEIGLPASAVELLGRLEPLETINGLTVVPFVGFVPTLPALSANAAEIDCVFQVPLRFLSDPDNLLCDEYALDGKTRRVARFHYGDFAIWGFTATVLVRLCAGVLNAPLDLRRARAVVHRIDVNERDATRLRRVPSAWRTADDWPVASESAPSGSGP